MPRIIYFNGSLAITSFNVQGKGPSGAWVTPTCLSADKPYRFVVHVLNNSGDPTKVDLTNLKVTDLLNPLHFFWPPRGQAIALSHIHVAVGAPPAGLGAYRFYSDANYSGGWTNFGNANYDQPLARGESANLYVYFKWASGPVQISPTMPGKFVPQVKMKAKELRINPLPEGPLANLQPNT